MGSKSASEKFTGGAPVTAPGLKVVPDLGQGGICYSSILPGHTVQVHHHFSGRTLLDLSYRVRRVESHNTKTTTPRPIVSIGPGASRTLPYFYVRLKTSTHLRRRASRATQPKLASNSSATTGDRDHSRTPRMLSSHKCYATCRDNPAPPPISGLANDHLAATIQFTPLGATVRSHGYLLSTRAHQLDARGNARRRSIYSLWTYSIGNGNFHF